MRPAPPGAAPVAAPAGALLYGVTDDRLGTVQAPIVLRTGAGGRMLVATLYTLSTSCRGVPRHFNNYTPAIRVGADGRFSGGETFTIAGATYRVRIAGHFLAGPAVEGTIRLAVTSRRRRCAAAARTRFRAVA